MGVDVHVFQAGLMDMPMTVLGSVGVAVRMLMLDVVVLVGGVRVRVGHPGMPVLVGVRCVVAVVVVVVVVVLVLVV